ncbi:MULTISPECIES: hypothetical protein [Brenneria]|uniref:hypothetical protein n=1 Tax=Brenneria TaxID=71655 RepID=UPI0012E9A11A|nr:MULTISPECIES: hypothetical protein [Brenneria]
MEVKQANRKTSIKSVLTGGKTWMMKRLERRALARIVPAYNATMRRRMVYY